VEVNFAATGHRRNLRSKGVAVLVSTVVLLLITGGTVVLLSGSTPSTSHELGVAGSTGGSPTHSPLGDTVASTTSTSSVESAAIQEAQQIEMQAGDLPEGWVQGSGNGTIQTSPYPPGACNIFGNTTWVANVSSPGFESPTLWNALSQVVVLPNSADAQTALRTFSSPQYDTNCLQPQWDQWVKQGLNATDSETPCDLTFGGSTIGSWLPEGMSENAPGAVGYQYQAQVDCPTEGPSTLTRLAMSAAVGNIFIQSQFYGGGTPSQIVDGPLIQMDYRATQLTEGKPVG